MKIPVRSCHSSLVNVFRFAPGTPGFIQVVKIIQVYVVIYLFFFISQYHYCNSTIAWWQKDCHPYCESVPAPGRESGQNYFHHASGESLTSHVQALEPVSLSFFFVENKTEPPQLKSSCDGGKVPSSHVVKLSCNTPDAVIYYTTDGMAPHLHSTKIKVALASKSHLRSKLIKH